MSILRSLLIVLFLVVHCFGETVTIDPGKGDGIADSTEAIRDAVSLITSSRASSRTFRVGGGIRFESGIYRITETIDLPTGHGFRMEGQGICVRRPARGIMPAGGPWLHSTKYPFLATVLMWDGEPGQAMFRYSGVGGSFDGLSFWGDDSDGGVGLAFHVYQPGQRGDRPGIAIGHANFGLVTFSHFGGSGIQCGREYGDGNCADMSFDHLEFYQCLSGLRVLNSQGMNFAIRFCQAYECEQIFDFEGGGKLWCGLLSDADNGRMLRLCRQGTGNGIFSFGLIACDRERKVYGRWPRVVETFSLERDGRTISPRATVVVDALHIPNDMWGSRVPGFEELFRVDSPSQVIVRFGQYLPPSCSWDNVIFERKLEGFR